MGYQVLLVDDEQASFELMEAKLGRSRKDRFELHWESEFEVAAAELLAGNYDVCLLDYKMGNYTGLEFMAHVRERGNRVPIIMLTGHGSREVDMEALRAGAAEFLDKTDINHVWLARTIRYAVQNQRIRNELEDLYQQVSELEQLKTDMIRIAAHDLRTPLMTLLNYTQFLMQDTDNPLADYQQNYTENMLSSIRRMQQIIGDILSLERIAELADANLNQAVDLTTLTEKVVEQHVPPQRKLSLSLDVVPVTVLGDSAQLREAVTNLVSNAVKYTPDGGEIGVRLRMQGNTASLEVMDTGYGIPEAMQPRLFQPFYRAKSKETRHIEGTGLGLHLVRNIVRRHNGEMIFHSVYGEGSTFGFRLPLFDGGA
jgi:signal transduction histidine kinase